METAEIDPLSALEDLLSTEAEAARRADFGSLAELAARKEALLEALLAGPAPEPGRLEALRHKARRTAAVLQAARRGLRAARRRIAELQKAGDPETYAADGRRQGLEPAQGTLERRA